MFVWLADTLQDLRQAVRVLARAPGFSIACVLMLAMGICLASSMFSIVNPLLFRPLPFKDPDRLVSVTQNRPRQNLQALNLSYADYLDWRRQNHVFSDMGIIGAVQDVVGGSDRPQQVRGERVSASLFPTLGVRPFVGRDFNAADEQPGAPSVVIISHRLWRSRYGGDHGVIGKVLDVNGTAHVVIGIMPPRFNFESEADVWIPFVARDIDGTRGNYQFNGYGRLKPGVTRRQAQADLSAVAARIEREHPESNAGVGAVVAPMRQGLLRGTQAMSWILLGAACIVMILACVNVSGLFLVRAIGRQKEFAIRLAVGASRWQIVRQLLVEGIILSAVAGALGVVGSTWATRLALTLVDFEIPPWLVFNIDARVLGFAIGASVLTCVLFALAPAWTVAGLDTHSVLKDSGPGSGGGRRHYRLRGLLVIAEVALALALLTSSGMMLHTLGNFQAVDPGFNPEGLMTFRISLPTDRYTSGQERVQFFRMLRDRLRSMPGIEAVGGISSLPLNGAGSWQPYAVEGEPPLPQVQSHLCDFRLVTPGYFSAMEIELIRGRVFRDEDNLSSTRVAMIDESFARRHFEGRNPIGRRIMWGDAGNISPARIVEIVGVVADVKMSGLDMEDRPCLYIPHAQLTWKTQEMGVRVGSGNPADVIAGARRILREIDPTVPLSKPRQMRDIVRESYWASSYILKLFGIFSGVALLLAVSGIAGVMMCMMTQRTREIGIRMALGARPHDVMRMILAQGLRLVLIGLALGLAASFAFARVLSSFLFQVGTFDLVSILGSVALFLAVALASCYMPARRAMRIDPMTALRTE
ncbi:MAG: ABC transporter permease [Candidatus Sumerlaeia bacterium]